MRLFSPCCTLSVLLSLAPFVFSESQLPLAAIQKPLNDTEASSAVESALTLTTTEHVTSTRYNVVAVVTMTRPRDLVATTCGVDARHSERALVEMAAEGQSSTTIYTLIQTIMAEFTTFTFACSIDPLIPQCRATQAAIAASKAAATATESLTSISPSSSSEPAVSRSEPDSSVSPTSASSVDGSSLSHSTATTVTATQTGNGGVMGGSSTTNVSRSEIVSSDTAADALPTRTSTVTLTTTVFSVSVLRVEETTYSIATTTTVTAGASSIVATGAAARTTLACSGCSILALLLWIFHVLI
ncbi:hypothetical protein BDV97DRAFT_364974 [Delphinella strobiligena]|nr:hypothetical protein BDV97DRAFT_364974 [Delphinella strobiligena]